MLVDTLLEYYGHNPASFVTNSDKWIDVSIDIMNTCYPIITVTLTIIPWILYFIYRKHHTKNPRGFILRMAKWSIVGLAFGLFLPTLVLWIMGSLAVRALYGNQGFF